MPGEVFGNLAPLCSFMEKVCHSGKGCAALQLTKKE